MRARILKGFVQQIVPDARLTLLAADRGCRILVDARVGDQPDARARLLENRLIGCALQAFVDCSALRSGRLKRVVSAAWRRSEKENAESRRNALHVDARIVAEAYR